MKRFFFKVGNKRYYISENKVCYRVTCTTRYTIRTVYTFYKDIFYSTDEVKAFILNVLHK